MLERITREGLQTRRNFLKGTVASAALELLPRTASAEGKISYLEALIGDDKKKQEYIDQKVAERDSGNSVSVEYATPAIEQELASKYHYQRAEFQFGATFVDNPAAIGSGAKIKLYIFPKAFSKIFRQYGKMHAAHHDLHRDMDTIISNIIDSGFVIAGYLASGIPNYPIDRFKDKSGNLNRPMRDAVFKMIILKIEYSGLLNNAVENPRSFLAKYVLNMANQGRRLYAYLHNPSITQNMDPRLLQDLYKDFNPNKLFPDPRTIKQV